MTKSCRQVEVGKEEGLQPEPEPASGGTGARGRCTHSGLPRTLQTKAIASCPWHHLGFRTWGSDSGKEQVHKTLLRKSLR